MVAPSVGRATDVCATFDVLWQLFGSRRREGGLTSYYPLLNMQASVLPQNWDGNEPNRTVTCMVLKATANDRRRLALCHDEIVDLDLAYADQVASVTTTK
ncbi:hypothetical protein TNCV_3878851 [Trichonephila clavipes]|nr:hypothetical protein TNCV_3878851 [Trichonephila clavipes]